MATLFLEVPPILTAAHISPTLPPSAVGFLQVEFDSHTVPVIVCVLLSFEVAEDTWVDASEYPSKTDLSLYSLFAEMCPRNKASTRVLIYVMSTCLSILNCVLYL